MMSENVLNNRWNVWLFLTILVFFFCSPIVTHDFFCDDYRYINAVRENGGALTGALKVATGIPFSQVNGYFRPVHDMVFSFVFVANENPAVQYVLNIFLHLFNVFLVFAIGCRLMPRSGSLIAATVFALWPGNVQAVAWVSCRSDLLIGFFCMSSLLCFDKFLFCQSRKRAVTYWFVSFLLFLFALFAKEPAISLPLVIFVLYLYRKEEKIRSPGAVFVLLFRKQVFPFFLLALVYTVFHALMVRIPGSIVPLIDLVQLVPNIGRSFLSWFVRAIPIDLLGKTGQNLFAIYLMSVLAWTGISLWRTGTMNRGDYCRKVSFFSLGYLGLYLPIILIAGWPGESLERSRYFYLPGLAFAIGVGALAVLAMQMFSKRQKCLFFTCLGFFLVVIGAAFHYQVRVYGDGSRSFTEVARLLTPLEKESEKPIAVFLPVDMGGVPVFPYGLPEAIAFFDQRQRRDVALRVYDARDLEDARFISGLQKEGFAFMSYDQTHGMMVKIGLKGK